MGLKPPLDLALDPLGGKLYIAEAGNGNRIRSANLDGTGLDDPLNPLLSVTGPSVLEFDSVFGHLYYSAGTMINRVNLDGTGDISLFPTVDPNLDPTPNGAALALTLDVANDRIFWSELSEGTIHRGDLSTQSLEAIVSGVAGVNGLDVDRGQLYWTIGDQVHTSNTSGSNQQLLYNVSGIGLGRIAAVPEPSTVLLAFCAKAMLILFWGMRRRRG